MLLVEDDVRMAAAVRRALKGAGVVADVAVKGSDALWMVRSADYDAVVLDVMLPDIDGFETCKQLRADSVWVPIIMLTARDSVDDRVRGWTRGADDYLTKPFSLRGIACAAPCPDATGTRSSGQPCCEVGDLRMDPAARQVWRGDRGRSSCRPGSSRCSRSSCAEPGQVFTSGAAARARHGISATRHRRTSSRCMCATSARRSIARLACARSRRFAGCGYRLRKDGGG